MSVFSSYHAMRATLAKVDLRSVARPSGALRLLLCAGLLIAAIDCAQADPLRDALMRAYRANPTLNAQRSKVLGTLEELPRAKAGYLPKLNATGEAGINRETNTDPDGTRTSLATNPRGVGLTLDQKVFDGFRTPNSVRQARLQVLATAAATP